MINNNMLNFLEKLLDRRNEIDKNLENNENIKKNINEITNLLKEKSKINSIVSIYLEYKNIINIINEYKNLVLIEKNNELLEWSKKEIKILEISLKKNEDLLKNFFINNDNLNENKNVIIEIRGAAGGSESNIFCGDLYKMYFKYSEKQNWKLKLINKNESEYGGFSYISFLLKGHKVYSKMKFESGAHRVQRIPKTENKGRVHTSISTVVVLPEIEEIDFKIKLSDLKIDTYRSSGAGGQHVNTTDSAVRITHIPSKIVVTSQNGRSQHDNKSLALQHLRSKLYEINLQEKNKKLGEIRKFAIGSGERNEKIRTYNFPQNRITDHRINLTLQKLDKIIEGDLDEILLELINNEERNNIKNK